MMRTAVCSATEAAGSLDLTEEDAKRRHLCTELSVADDRTGRVVWGSCRGIGRSRYLRPAKARGVVGEGGGALWTATWSARSELEDSGKAFYLALPS